MFAIPGSPHTEEGGINIRICELLCLNMCTINIIFSVIVLLRTTLLDEFQIFCSYSEQNLLVSLCKNSKDLGNRVLLNKHLQLINKFVWSLMKDTIVNW